MTIAKDHNRQWPLVALFFYGTVTDGADPDRQVLPSDGTDNETIDLPAGAIVTGGEVVVTVVSNAVTTDVLDLGDATVENRYVNDVNLKSLGKTALVPTGFVHTTKTGLTARRTQTGGAPTAGSGYVRVEYVITGRGNETQV